MLTTNKISKIIYTLQSTYGGVVGFLDDIEMDISEIESSKTTIYSTYDNFHERIKTIPKTSGAVFVYLVSDGYDDEFYNALLNYVEYNQPLFILNSNGFDIEDFVDVLESHNAYIHSKTILEDDENRLYEIKKEKVTSIRKSFIEEISLKSMEDLIKNKKYDELIDYNILTDNIYNERNSAEPPKHP